MDGFMGSNMGEPSDIPGSQYDVPDANPYVPEEAPPVQMQPVDQPEAQAAQAPLVKAGGNTLLLAGLCGAAGIALGLMFAKRK